MTESNANNSKLIALVPMKHHSERVPGKNYRLFNGKPLYTYIVETLLDCSSISEIVINTDSSEIIDGLKAEKRVRIIDRPASLRGDMVPMNQIILHDIQHSENTFFLQTHSTNPLIKPESIQKAIDTFWENYPTYDSLFSVTKVQTRFWDQLTMPVNHNPSLLLRTQDLPPLYEENSCIYIFNKNVFTSRMNRIGHKPYMFELDAEEAVDIDTELDFKIAETIQNHS